MFQPLPYYHKLSRNQEKPTSQTEIVAKINEIIEWIESHERDCTCKTNT